MIKPKMFILATGMLLLNIAGCQPVETLSPEERREQAIDRLVDCVPASATTQSIFFDNPGYMSANTSIECGPKIAAYAEDHTDQEWVQFQERRSMRTRSQFMAEETRKKFGEKWRCSLDVYDLCLKTNVISRLTNPGSSGYFVEDCTAPGQSCEQKKQAAIGIMLATAEMNNDIPGIAAARLMGTMTKELAKQTQAPMPRRQNNLLYLDRSLSEVTSASLAACNPIMDEYLTTEAAQEFKEERQSTLHGYASQIIKEAYDRFFTRRGSFSLNTGTMKKR